ncbi:DUF2806 domain-containing protein [Flavobacterium sp. B183]|uniref:DUF2806 domain-containing protein n=1 Tax=Flavobacterium sp. B183 TaxID=907046 RepID=UPI00201F1BB4|nr:DUF2806 domain-containing protein [Flavobacterium sp. B183]URC12124.1 DUF2806 domain-containing protein [Flavobacterium sp. B183]
MELIKFEGKPIEKLVEVISQGIGTLYKPRAIRKEAEAEAYKIEIIERAKSKAQAESKLFELETLNVIEQKLLFQEKRKQENIDNIIEVAITQINQESDVSSEKVDTDWATRFFNIAEDISSEEMQKLWGRVLSGEVKNPGAFSLRTLDVLKNLTKQEAEVFTKFVPLRIKSQSSDFIPYEDKAYLEKALNISYTDILLMMELGLINHTPDLAIITNGIRKSYTTLFENGNMAIFIETTANKNKSSVKILNFTKIGCELSSLVPFESNVKYLLFVAKLFSTPYTKIKVGKLEDQDGQKVLTNFVDID